MRGAFWNIRGSGKEGKRQRISEIIGQYHLDFLGIQETIKAVFTNSYLNGLAGSKNFEWTIYLLRGLLVASSWEWTKMFLRF
jgi:hypothetical protein